MEGQIVPRQTEVGVGVNGPDIVVEVGETVVVGAIGFED
jgi:hypothetical protein